MNDDPAARELDGLVAGALGGDTGAMDRLLRILRPLVVRYCRSRLGGYERVNASPDDVAQEVCLAVLRALPTYQDQGRPFLAFVYGIAQHKVVDAHRSAGRDRSDPVEELPEEQDVRDGPEQHALALSDSVEMAALLEHLPEKQREVLRLRVVVGLSAEETAEAVGSTAGAVRVAQHRALAKLRALISERTDTGSSPVVAGAAPPPAPPRRRAGPPAGRGRRDGATAPDPSGGAALPTTALPTAVGPLPASPPTAPVASPGRRAAADGPGPGPVTTGHGGLPDLRPDWARAPRTGRAVLDRLLTLSDEHLLRASRGDAPAPGPDDLDRVARDDAVMAEVARRFG